MKPKNFTRKDFFKIAILGTSAIGAVQINAKTRKPYSSEPNKLGPKYAMVIDQSKCTGCRSCEMACKASNDVAPDIAWTKVYETNVIAEEPIFTPIQCMHCEHAPCVSVCPVGASYYRDDGIVMMDYDRCIGCRYCQVACPYHARSFNWKEFDGENPHVPEWGEPDIDRRPRGVVEKCTFCVQKIDRGLANNAIPGVDSEATPACVSSCPMGARIFGDITDPNSPVSIALENSVHYQLKENLGTGPRIYYLPANKA